MEHHKFYCEFYQTGYVFSFLSKTPFPKNYLPPDENLYWVGPLNSFGKLLFCYTKQKS